MSGESDSAAAAAAAAAEMFCVFGGFAKSESGEGPLCVECWHQTDEYKRETQE